jgi:hypothetical protein
MGDDFQDEIWDLRAVNVAAMATPPWYREDEAAVVVVVAPPVVPSRVGGGGPWIKIEGRPRRAPRALKYVASGGVAVSGTAEILFTDATGDELDLTDDDQARTGVALAVWALRAVRFDLRRVEFRQTGVWPPLPEPDIENPRDAARRMARAHVALVLTLVREALDGHRVTEVLAELEKHDAAFARMYQLLREQGVLDDDADDGAPHER